MTLFEQFIAIINNAELSPREQFEQVMAASQPARDAQDWDALDEIIVSRELRDWVEAHGMHKLMGDE